MFKRHSFLDRGNKAMKNDSGFSMMELLVSTIIFSLGVLSLGHVFIQGVKTIHRTKYQTRATNIARELMEEIQSKAFDEAMIGEKPTTEMNSSEFTDYATKEDTTSGFPLDAGEIPLKRASFDDIDDYANFFEDPVLGDDKYFCSVRIVYADEDALNGPAKKSQSHFKRITVKVTSKTYDQIVALSSVSYYGGM
jgi:type IV pilus modification protein PilV